MMSQASKPDSDSMMALQALLKIRSDSVASEQEAVLSNTNAANFNNETSLAAAKAHNAKAHNAKPVHNKRHATKQSVPPGPSFSHVTPPFGAISPRSALSPTFTLNYGLQNTNDAPFSPVVSTTSAVEPVAVPSASGVLPASFTSVDDTEKTQCASNTNDSSGKAEKPVVRTTEIQAALRSKPQRGRKRDNLSELERLELTRTRNREHAKSTRIRKKARHQELLDNEQKYLELQKVQDLCKKRSECVHCFLSIRESMLRSSLDEPARPEARKPNSGSSSNGTEQEQGLVTPQRSVKFVQFSMATESFLSNPSSGNQDALGKVVDFETGFEFSCIGGTLASSPDASQEAGQSVSTNAMNSFDKSLATRVEELMGNSFVKKLSYSVDPKEGVAINEHGTGFAEVTVSTQDHHQERTIMTAILKLTFVPDSDKLKSVVWHITDERFDHASNGEDSDCPSAASSESLGCQMSFPSVVSLDQSGDAAEQKLQASTSAEGGDGSGPGMNI